MITIASVHDGATSIYRFLSKYPVIEITTLLVLALLTVFRRKLSSNDEYRRKSPPTPKVSKQSRKSLAVLDKRPSSNVSFPKLSTEVMVNVVSYMTNHEIACFMTTSKKMYKDLSTDAIWEQLWLQTYGAMWQHPEIRRIREGRGIYWDPLLNYGPPQQGWYRFFLLFEVSYMDWILAGYCTHSRCLVGINHAVVDVTSFIDVHPGSRETLTEGAGCDATDMFNEIGHSTRAEQLMNTFKIWDVGCCSEPACRCNDAHLQEDICGHCRLAHRGKLASTRHIACEFSRQMRHFPAYSRLHEHMKLNQKKVTEMAVSTHKQAASDAMVAAAGQEVQFDGFASVVPLIEAAVTANVPTTYLTGSVDSGDGYDSDSADTASLSSAVSSSSGSSGVYSDEVGEGVIDTEDIPDMSQHVAMFSPAKALTSFLDKVKREVRKGSLQLRGVSGSSFTRQRGSGVGGDGAPNGGNGEEDEYVPPIASYFAPSHPMVPLLDGFFPCVHPQDHMGQPKAFFDPFTEEWTAWWTCCGQGHVLVEAPTPPSDKVRLDNFCK